MRIDDEVLTLVSTGDYDAAARLLVERAGVTREQAAEAIQGLRSDITPLDPAARAMPPQVDAAIRAGRKIEAIKLYREAFGVGLKEAKDAVEAHEADRRRSRPTAGAGANRPGFLRRLFGG